MYCYIFKLTFLSSVIIQRCLLPVRGANYSVINTIAVLHLISLVSGIIGKTSLSLLKYFPINFSWMLFYLAYIFHISSFKGMFLLDQWYNTATLQILEFLIQNSFQKQASLNSMLAFWNLYYQCMYVICLLKSWDLGGTWGSKL